jgi:hypothetical protein
LLAADGFRIAAQEGGYGEAPRERAPTFGLAVAHAYQGRGLVGKPLGFSETPKVWAREAAIPIVVLTVVQDNAIAWRLYD